jgi:starch-binding outer membrane protein, SusD/RagB family
MKTSKSIYIAEAVVLTTLLSCTDFIQIDPPDDQIVKSIVFSDDNYAVSAITGIYSELSSNGFANGAQGCVTMLAGLSADEFTIYTTSSDYVQFNDNSLMPGNSQVSGLWNSCYKTIYMANSVIEGLNGPNGLSSTTKMHLLGEAKFLRAFSYFYLTSLFGDVPIATTTDVNVNRSLTRAPQNNVFEQIEKDLVDAREFLPESYAIYNHERARATKYAASAMLARLYLYKKDWQRAEAESTRVIAKIDEYTLVTELDKVFLKNSKEAIWQLIPRTIDTNEGLAFVLLSKPGLVSLTDGFAMSFGETDKRGLAWKKSISIASGGTDPSQTYYYPSKYRRGQISTGEYSMVLRLAEQYLIRSEARLKQNKLTGNESAESDLNSIRNRAGLANTVATSADDLMADVMVQRHFEFFAEWGHRWFDLKRTGQTTAVLQPIKPFWKSTSILYPLPQYELVNNHGLLQNDGYSN